MDDSDGRPGRSSPRNIRRSSSTGSGTGKPLTHSTRQTSTARLASPVLSSSHVGTPPLRQVPPLSQSPADRQDELPGVESRSSLPGPGASALAAALWQRRNSDMPPNETSPRATPPLRLPSPAAVPSGTESRNELSQYGSYDTREGNTAAGTYEDLEVVRRHLVVPESARGRQPLSSNQGSGISDEDFSSLQLQGGDTTRPIYKWTEEQEGNVNGQSKRRNSFNVPRPEPESETTDISAIKVPGGFRRDFLRRTVDGADSNEPNSIHDVENIRPTADPTQPNRRPQPQLLTSNFLEFLTIYGHFAGEELEEDDELLESDDYFSSDVYDDSGGDGAPGETSALLSSGVRGVRRRKHKERGPSGTNTSSGAALLLLKSFVGTGVLFLPRAFLNGGMLFSSLILLAVAGLSFYCFILLVNTRLKVEASFGDIGGILYGKWMRGLILSSIVLSQIGFVAAYVVFTSENLQAFILAVSRCRSYIDIKWMVLMQLLVFLPLSLIRDISKLGFTALVADIFIMLGLIYLYYYDVATLVQQHGVSDIKNFNPASWSLFIGTAIFTFEGVGLIIPIQESMKRQQDFPRVLGVIMVVITILFTSIGALSYAAYGSKTRTVVILNLPQDDKFVNGVQFLYSLAILLSTPLQLFPAIRIMENELFTRSGKYDPRIKWKKNIFRFCLVMLCAMVGWGGADDLDKFVALVGSFACVPLVYVYPPLLHLRAVASSTRQRIADYTVFCFGLICCAYTSLLTISSWAGDSNPQQEQPPGYCDE